MRALGPKPQATPLPGPSDVPHVSSFGIIKPKRKWTPSLLSGEELAIKRAKDRFMDGHLSVDDLEVEVERALRELDAEFDYGLEHPGLIGELR